MVADESNNREYWKTQSHDLQSQLFSLYRLNASLSKQIEESHQERLKFVRILQRLTDGTELVQNDKNRFAINGNDYDIFFTFPEEIWPSILVYVTNSADLLNLCDASPTLNIVLLHKDKPVWLFDQILPIIFKQLAEADVLACRLVCRKWNQATGSYLDGYHSPQTPYKVQKRTSLSPRYSTLSSHFTQPVWKRKLSTIDFDSTTDLTTFLAEVKVYQQTTKGENLLINRSLKLGLDMNNVNDDIYQFWELAITVLELVGQDVWHIEIYNDGLDEEPASFYGMFQHTLLYLPKLKTLRLVCDFENENFEHEDLVARLGTWPLPCLPYLETLHVLHSLPSPMIATIASSYARQIRKFVVSVAILILLETEHLRGFLNLSELVIRNCAKNLLEFQGIFKQLERLESPNLEKLRLFRSYSDNEVIATPYLFGLVAWKFPRLRDLNTYRIRIVEDSDVINTNCKLSSVGNDVCLNSLRTLRIRNGLKMSLDFLFKLPCLEELYIRVDSDFPSHSDQQDDQHNDQPLRQCDEVQSKSNSTLLDIKRFLYQGKMYQSNVWRLIPSLKVIIYEDFAEQIHKTSRYTREMYDYMKK